MSLIWRKTEMSFPLIVGQQTVKKPGVKKVHEWAGGGLQRREAETVE